MNFLRCEAPFDLVLSIGHTQVNPCMLFQKGICWLGSSNEKGKRDSQKVGEPEAW